MLAVAVFVAAFPWVAGQVAPAPGPMAAPAPGPAPAPAIKPQPTFFNYKQHGTDWQFGTCGSRLRQSPVSLDRLLTTPPSNFADFNYQVINDPLPYQAKGGMLVLDLSAKLYGGVVYNDEWYPITSLVIHGPAEHLFRGYQNPVELQLVHRKANDPMQNLVVSVLIWCENAAPPPNISAPAKPFQKPSTNEVDFNVNVQKLLGVAPPNVEGLKSTLPPGGLDLNVFVNNPLVPGSGEYLNYRGSLTSPPCLDTATWFVRRKTVVASRSQVQAFTDALYRMTTGAGSFRSIMPMNRRFLKVFALRQQVQLKVSDYEFLPWGPNPRTAGEMEAVKLAKMAEEKAEHTASYAAGFARRLRNADVAFAKGLQGPPLTREAALADAAAKEEAERKIVYKQRLRNLRASVLGSARGVQRSIDQAFRTATQTVYEAAQFENNAADRLFNKQ